MNSSCNVAAFKRDAGGWDRYWYLSLLQKRWS